MKIATVSTVTAYLISVSALATPTIYPKDMTFLSTITNTTNSNLVADDSDPRVIWVMPPNTAASKVQGLHTITSNVGFCQEMANLQSYSATMSARMKDLELRELESGREVKELEAKLSHSRQELAQYISMNNLAEIQMIDDRLQIVEQSISVLTEKLSACQENCSELMSQLKELRDERNSLSNERRQLVKTRIREVRDMERKKAAVQGFEKDLETMDARWRNTQKNLDDIRTKFNDMYSAFGKLEGARAAINFESNWDTNIEELRRNNPKFDFKQIHTQNAVITTSLVGSTSLPGSGAIMAYELAGQVSEGKMSFPSYPQSLSGNVRLSLLGTCPILYPELFNIKVPTGTDQMKYGMVVSYDFPSSFEVDVTAKYNMYKMYEKISKSGRSGGFFSSRRWTSVEEKTFFRDEFKVTWNEQDRANSLTEEQKADYEKEMRDNIFGRLAAIGLPSLPNPGALIPPAQGETGAAVLASALAKEKSCQMNKYCIAASIGLNVLDAIFGNSVSAASYKNIQDVEMTERWSRKEVVYKPWISSYR